MQALPRVIRASAGVYLPWVFAASTCISVKQAFFLLFFSNWLQKYIVKITEKETYIKTKQNKAEDG